MNKFQLKVELNTFHMKRDKLFMNKLRELNLSQFKESLLNMKKLLDNKLFQFKELFKIIMPLSIKLNIFPMLSNKLSLNMSNKNISLKEFNILQLKPKLFIIHKLNSLLQELTLILVLQMLLILVLFLLLPHMLEELD